MNKDRLDNHLAEHSISQIWFKEGDKVNFHANFGCGLYVYKGLWGPSAIDLNREYLDDLDDEDFDSGDDDDDEKQSE